MVVFLISSYIVILYAQGYKYSFSENKFFKTGAIYLKVNTGANVYMDNMLLGNTSFFSNSHRIEGLLPSSYEIKVEKENYSSWHKLIKVDEGFVSEFSKILLIDKSESGIEELKKEIVLIFPTPSPTGGTSPKANIKTTPLTSPKEANSKATSSPTPAPEDEPFLVKKDILMTTGEKPEKIAEGVKGFVLSGDKNKIAWWMTNEVWVMWLNDTNYPPYHKKGDKEFIIKFPKQIKKVAWFRDEDHLILDFGEYKIIEVDTRGGLVNIIEV